MNHLNYSDVCYDRNILLDDNETVVIVDFGLAVNDALSGTSKSLLLQDYYGARAPEWNEKAEYIDSGLDAYHAGCCIFNILTGIPLVGQNWRFPFVYEVVPTHSMSRKYYSLLIYV